MKEEKRDYVSIVTTSTSKGHKCGEKKLFYIDCEEEEEQELEPSQDPEPKETTPTISCHALVGISTPQTLKIEGYIKKKR
jgi:hypothetical protein